MTERLERDKFIDLLNRLGSDQDDDVLEAARQLHAYVTDAGVTWEDLLVSDEVDHNGDDAEHHLEEEENESAEPTAERAKEDADSLALIDKMLSRPGVSESLREELESYKEDIAEGEFEQSDRQYIRAVYERLSKPST